MWLRDTATDSDFASRRADMHLNSLLGLYTNEIVHFSQKKRDATHQISDFIGNLQTIFEDQQTEIKEALEESKYYSSD